MSQWIVPVASQTGPDAETVAETLKEMLQDGPYAAECPDLLANELIPFGYTTGDIDNVVEYARNYLMPRDDREEMLQVYARVMAKKPERVRLLLRGEDPMYALVVIRLMG